MARATNGSRLVGLGVLLAALAFAGTVHADPPDRVGRISFLSGPVSFRPAALDEWGDATLNYPLTTGDNLWTDRAGRAEVQTGSVVARLGANTSFSVLDLDDRLVQLRITQGSLAVSVRRLFDDESVEVDTPNGAVSLVRPGFYRIDVNEEGDTSTITVREGEGEVTSGGQTLDIAAHQSAVVTGLDSPNADLEAAVRPDEWEDWCQGRERQAKAAVSARYVSPDTIGYADLDDFGTWQNVEGYGPVWVPDVRADWAPYRDGHWAWVEPWGWTWIDAAPWGFAPFHYGRWARLRTGWCWVPGAEVARPVYAPALVVFVGGSDWRPSAAVGESLGWFPLGPREVYVPAYQASPAYLSAVNNTTVNVTNIKVTNVTYVNETVPGAVTAVPRDIFVAGRPVAQAVRVVPAPVLSGARIVGTAAPVAPVPESVVSRGDGRVATPPRSAVERRVVVRTPPPAPPVPFAARQQALSAHPGEPVDEATLRTLRPGGEATHPLVRAVVAPPANRSQRGNRPEAVTGTAGRSNARPNEPPSAPTNVRPPAPEPARPPAKATERRMPPEAVKPPDPNAGSLAAQHRAQVQELEARHAAETAQLKERQVQEQQRAEDAHQRQQIQQRQQEEARALQERQVREHQRLQQQQEKQKAAQTKAKEKKKDGKGGE